MKKSEFWADIFSSIMNRGEYSNRENAAHEADLAIEEYEKRFKFDEEQECQE